jgi:hypothetical protein
MVRLALKLVTLAGAKVSVTVRVFPFARVKDPAPEEMLNARPIALSTVPDNGVAAVLRITIECFAVWPTFVFGNSTEDGLTLIRPLAVAVGVAVGVEVAVAVATGVADPGVDLGVALIELVPKGCRNSSTRLL